MSVVTPPAGSTRAATIYDVARLAGVSHQTVSRVLNDEPGTRAATRERVRAAIASLGYRRNSAATALASRRSHRLGALVTGMLESGPSKFIDGAATAARQAGYVLDIVSLDHTGRDATQATDLLDQHDLAGVVILAPSDQVHAALATWRPRVPVLVATALEDDHTDPDGHTGNTAATRAAVEHLLGLGHTRIALVAGPDHWASAAARTHAYHATMAAHRLPSLPVIPGDWSARSGHLAGHALDPTTTTAVLAANDQMALGVIRALSERGIAVPEAISAIGIDDIPEAGYFLPPLTTVHLDFHGYGHHAITTLLRTIDPVGTRPTPAPEPPRLVVRASTAPPVASAATVAAPAVR
ncbi:lactose operon repressor [mine drainage metagenome]|uniref:Lactose operon repressor n=1 Tax=mine drainage metagenome TaxID=410659 RepID=A0A1J5RIA4_9ZZZZ